MSFPQTYCKSEKKKNMFYLPILLFKYRKNIRASFAEFFPISKWFATFSSMFSSLYEK